MARTLRTLRPMISRMAFAFACLTVLACGKVAPDDDHDPSVTACPDAHTECAPERHAEKPVECTTVARVDECKATSECPVDFVCGPSGRSAPTHVEVCSDGTRRNVTDDSSPILVCQRGEPTDPADCVNDDFHEECSDDAQCDEGESCVDSGRRMASSTVRCPDGSSSGSADARVVHECRVVQDGGS